MSIFKTDTSGGSSSGILSYYELYNRLFDVLPSGLQCVRPARDLLLSWTTGPYRLRRIHKLLFGENLRGDLSFVEVQAEFVDKVDAELFPVDLAMLDGIFDTWDFEYGSEPDVLMYGIPFVSFGVPRGGASFDELEEYERVLVACMDAVSGRASIPIEDYSGEEDIAILYSELLSEAGLLGEDSDDDDPGFFFFENEDWTLDRFRKETGIFSGVDFLYQCVLGNTNNPFIDTPSAWRVDCGYDDTEMVVDYDVIRRYADFYARIRDDVERFYRFTNWYESTENSRQLLSKFFASVEEEYRA